MSTNRFKFRAWDKKNKKYIESVVLDNNGELFYVGDVGDEWYELLVAKSCIIEQCTGLKDKNGKLIFEGDVVRYYRSTAMCLGGERIASVLWDEKYGAWGILTTLGDGYDMCDAIKFGIEIIGNIHEMDIETERS